jgi:hypothetical protein
LNAIKDLGVFEMAIFGSIAAAVAPSLIGGLMGGSGGSGGTTTTNTAPWVGQQPYLTSGFKNAQNWYNQGGTSVAPLNSMQNQSFNMAGQNANNPTLGAASNAIQNFAAGNMMNNPYLNQMANSADNSITRNYQNAVAPGISSNFEANGRYGSGAMSNSQGQAQQNLATQLGYTNANIFGNAYQQGMNNMLQASSLAPANNASTLANINQVNAAGNQQQAQQQAVNSQPLANMQGYQGLINGNFGSTTTQPYYMNQGANIMGGALIGNQIGNSLFGNANTQSTPSTSSYTYNPTVSANNGSYTNLSGIGTTTW